MATIKRLEGRDHFVVPMVMLTVGNHAGSNGPVFYPAEELSKTVGQWNGKPVVVYHPLFNNQAVSASDPDIVDRYKVGTVFNSAFDGQKLTAEAWIDVARVQEVDNRVADAILENRKLEVSTGLLMDFDTEVLNEGNPTARNYRPDHLAILPDKVGACSIEAGCGLMRNEFGSLPLDEDPLPLPSF